MCIVQCVLYSLSYFTLLPTNLSSLFFFKEWDACMEGGIFFRFFPFFRVWDGADNGLWVNEKKTSEYFLIFAYRFQVPSWLMNRSPYNLSVSCDARKWEDLLISAKLILDQDKATKGDVFRRVNFRQGCLLLQNVHSSGDVLVLAVIPDSEGRKH